MFYYYFFLINFHILLKDITLIGSKIYTVLQAKFMSYNSLRVFTVLRTF